MRQRRAFFSPACLFIPVCLIGGLALIAQTVEPQRAEPAEKTDYAFDNSQTHADEERIGTALKESLWRHWSKHVAGEFHVTAYTIEGDRSLTTFSFATYERSRWSVRVDSVFEIRDAAEHGKNAGERTDSRVYGGVKRIDLRTSRTIPDSEKRDATTYALLFINKKLHLKWEY
jgi:hypothetical protein